MSLKEVRKVQIKKINNDWQPAENPYLKIGETIEITDPRQLILDGFGVAVGSNGEELSAYELYGVITENEFDEFKKFKELQRAQQQAELLKQEQQSLQAQVQATTPAPVVTPIVPADVKLTYTDATPWKDLVDAAKAKGVYKVGMTKQEVIDALNA